MSDSYGAIVPPGGRGCGHRESGGVYLEQGMGVGGLPVEYFLVDPPTLVDEKDMGLSSVGVKLVFVPHDSGEPCSECKGDGNVETESTTPYDPKSEYNSQPVYRTTCESCDGTGLKGTWHVFDIVGQEAYPNVADFIEEWRRFGVSRRCELPSAEDYAKLTADSKLFLLHRRAWIDSHEGYYHEGWANVMPGDKLYHPCPKDVWEHELNLSAFMDDGVPRPTEMCLGLVWNDVEGGERLNETTLTFATEQSDRYVVRHMPSFDYTAVKPPESMAKPEDRGYKLAVFGKACITRIVVVASKDKSIIEKKVSRVKGSAIPYDVELE